jgi:hypothetical protein
VASANEEAYQMNHRLRIIGIIGAVSGLAWIFSSIGLAAGVIENPAVEDQALILPEFDRLYIETPVAPDFAVMNVRVFNSDNELVMSVRSFGEPVDFMVTNGLPDGEYNYEAVSVFTTDDLSKRSEVQSGAEEFMVRHFGSFTVSGGELIQQAEPGQDGDNPVFDEASIMDKVIKRSMSLAGFVLDVLVPSAQAVDVTVESSNPTVLFDDTSAVNTTCCEWYLIGNGNDSTGSFILEDRIAGNIHTVFSFAGSANFSLNENSVVVDSDGDIHWGGSGLNFDRGLSNLSIGTTATGAEIVMSASDPEIRYIDEAFSDQFYTNYDTDWFNIGYRGAFATNGNKVRISYLAPLNSMIIDPAGNVGIGTAVPSEAVDVERSAAAARFQLTSFSNTGNEAPQFVQRRALGSSGAPAAVTAGDNLGLFSFRGHTGTGFSGTKAGITVKATEPWSGSANGTRMLFQTTTNGTTALNTVLEITHDSKVKINGTTLNVPDYVFEDDYALMPLEELGAFVREHKHLPGVANAEQVNTGGLDIAGSQLSVLEKVEELTLYTLQQHDRLNALESDNTRLKEENAELRSHLGTLQASLARMEHLEQTVKLLLQQQVNDRQVAAIGR